MRQIKDVLDRRTKEKVYIRTHIKAVVTDDSGSTLEDYLGSNLIGRLVSLEDLIQHNGDGEAFLANDGSASGTFSSTATISSGTWIRAKDGWMSWYRWGSKYLVQSGNEDYDFVTA